MSSLAMRAGAVSQRSRESVVGLKEVLVTMLALAAMVAMVVVVRVGIYAVAHSDLPIWRDVIARIMS
jgi:hypothetical protein